MDEIMISLKVVLLNAWKNMQENNKVAFKISNELKKRPYAIKYFCRLK